MSVTTEAAGTPLISVVIPCWNAASWVSAAVTSCLDQTGVQVEVILVDDASTDATLSIIKALAAADSRVKVLTVAANGGPSNARNLGAAAATGDWISFADSDDVMLPGRLARLARLGEAWGADFVADQQMETIYPARAGGVIAFTPMGPDEAVAISMADYLRLAREGNSDVTHPPIRRSFGQLKPFVRRAFLARTGVDHDVRFRTGEDLHFHVRMLEAGARMIFVNTPGYVYRSRVDSLTYEDDLSYVRLTEMTDDLAALPLDARSRGYLNLLRRVFGKHAAYQRMRVAIRHRQIPQAVGWLLRTGPSGVLKLASTPLRRALRRMRSKAQARKRGLAPLNRASSVAV